MRIDSVHLHRLFGFDDFTLELRHNLTVLTGLNNAGKTSILRALRLALWALQSSMGRVPDVDRIGKGRALSTDLGQAAQHLGIRDSATLFQGGHVAGGAEVVLRCSDAAGAGELRVKCDASSSNIGVLVNPDQGSDTSAFLRGLFELGPEAAPSPGGVSSSEELLQYNQLLAARSQGKSLEIWRNNLYWLNNGKDPEFYRQVVDRISTYLPGVIVQPPRLSEQANLIEIRYQEDGAEFDIAAAGSGLHSLIGLCAALELSTSQLLLFDEPDAHMHSSLQRLMVPLLVDAAGEGKQVILTTHSPDILDVAPLESVIWIDRSQNAGQERGSLERLLLDLGAVNPDEGLRVRGANSVLFFEGKVDLQSLLGVLERCGHADLVRSSRTAVLKGVGNMKSLRALGPLLSNVCSQPVVVVVIRDADYTSPDPMGQTKRFGDVLEAKLPCKELENLVLLQPECIALAAENAAAARRERVDGRATAPDVVMISEKIDEITLADETRKEMCPRWLASWCGDQNAALDNETVLAEGMKELDRRCTDPEWRRRCMPGKLVLRRLRNWLAKEYSLSVSCAQLFTGYEPTEEVRKLFDAVATHVRETLEEAS
jgi:predicted ATPase